MENVTFPNGSIQLAGDLRIPIDHDGTTPLAAVVIATPGSSVKGQIGANYAERLTAKGFVTLAFDPSYQGQSGVEPRDLENPATRVEDIRCAVDYLDNVVVSYHAYLERAAKLYAHGHDLRDPLLSPVYGDMRGMPPAILTAGTRDLFLSNTVRVHRKLRQAGVEAQLEIFEGLSHAQFNMDPYAPVTREAYGEIATYFDKHLAR